MKSIFGPSANEYDALLIKLQKLNEITRVIASANTVEELSRLSQRFTQLNTEIKKLNSGQFVYSVPIKDPYKRT